MESLLLVVDRRTTTTQKAIVWFLHETPSSVMSAILQEWDIIFTVSLSIISTCRQATHEPKQVVSNWSIVPFIVSKIKQGFLKKN